MKNIYSLFCLSFLCISLHAQTDTAFWFAAPEVSIDNSTFDRPIVLRVTAYNQPSTVTISQPANAGFTPITVNVAANATSMVDLTAWIDQIENKPSNTVLNYGLYVSATTNVTAYYEVVSQQCLCNPEIFVLKGRNGLGTNFFIPAQNYLNNNSGYTPQPYSSFDIIATEDNTNVTITPSNNVVGHTAGIAYNITLNRGQTYSATAASQAAAQHLMGSVVTSDKPVAVTIKDDLLSGSPYGGCADLGGDQIVPLEHIGTKYAVVRGFLNAPYDKVFVLATQNNTSVSVDGSPVTTINTGQTYMVDMPNTARFIETSLPVYVLQLSGFGCEVGMSILPPIECTGSSSVAITRSTSEALFLNLIVRTGGQNNFLFNGNTGIINGSAFAPVPGTGGLYQYAQVTISTAQLAAGAPAIVSNTSDFFHLGVIHGTASGGTRFGYFSNFNRIEVNANGFAVPACEGFPLQLNANSPFSSATFQWTGPNGFNSTLASPVISNVQPVNAGNYTVVATVSGCPSEPDTVPIQITNCGQDISGVINIYTPVTAIDICTNSVTVGSSNGFGVGDRVLLIQMKGTQINTSNSTAFGNVTTYADAGNYEFGNILTVNGNQITLVNTIQRTYTISGLVQLIRVPQYSGNVHAIDTGVTCLPWNGTIGGVIAFEASGTVTLNADIDASNKGFRAGVANDNSPYTCGQQDYFYPSTSPYGGRKGEGIFELPLAVINGRGKNSNGGGGGNDTNSGGAGGGNYGTGGRGGNQWTGCANLPIGGDGGSALTYNNTDNKIFLGGGAGGGHQNDATATPGTNGGGIIIIKSASIATNGNAINSYAYNSVQASTDGSGGAGSGGTVLLQTNNLLGNLAIDVHGGKGGDNTSHGTGGGGGGGVVWTSGTIPANVALDLTGGQPGFHSGTNGNHGATAGAYGGILTGLMLPESTVPFTPLQPPVANVAVANICTGNNIALSVNTIANVTYSWTGPNSFLSNQQNPVINNAVVANSGDYIIAVENALNCVARDTVTVTVNSQFNFTQTISICDDESYTRPSGIAVNTSGTYIDTVHTVNGCDSIIETQLTVVDCTPDIHCNLICNTDFENEQVTPSNNWTLVNQSNLSCWNTTASDSLIEVWGTGFNGVPAYSGNQFIELNANFVSTLYQDFLALPGSTVDISFAHRGRSGVDVMSVSIGPPGGPYTTLGTFSTNNTAWQYYTVNYTFPAIAQVDYSLQFNSVSAAGGNQGVGNFLDAISITMPAINVNSTIINPSCPASADGSIQIDATGGTPPFAIAWNAPLSSTDLNVTGLNPGEYGYTVTDRYGCEYEDSITLTSFPDVSVTQNTTICANEIFIRPGGTGTNTAGVYIDTLQTVNGCDSIITTHLTVNPLVLATVYDTICANESYTRPSGIVVTQAGTYTDTVAASTGCDSIITTNLAVNPLQYATVYDTICSYETYTRPSGNTVTQAGIYVDTIAAVTGCDSIVTTNLTVINLDVSHIVTDVSCNGGNNGTMTVFWEGGIAPVQYVWNNPSFSGNYVTQVQAGNYNVTVTETFGCTAANTIVVAQPPRLAVQTSYTEPLCYEERNGTISATGEGGTPPYLYALGSDYSDSGSFDSIAVGTYTLTVTDSFDCSVQTNITVTQPEPVEIQYSPTILNVVLSGIPLTLSTNYGNGATFLWTPSSGLSCSDCPDPIILPDSTTEYNLTVTVRPHDKDCVYNFPFLVGVSPSHAFYIPNAFSPNGDSRNEYFQLFTNGNILKQVYVSIFNRWGEKIFESHDEAFKWDGRYLGNLVSPGIYVYEMKLVFLDNQTENIFGSITVLR